MLSSFLLIFISSLAYSSIGKACSDQYRKLLCRVSRQAIPIAEKNARSILVVDDYFYWCLGLLTHLWVSYYVYMLGIGLQFSFVFTLVLLVLSSLNYQREFLKIIENIFFTTIKNGISFEFLIYFSIVCLIGITIYSADSSGIRTLWANNYGDLPFHFGLIANFAKNITPLTVYPIHSAEPLSYYFLFDFWSACLWYDPFDWKALAFIFFMQWVLCWTLIYCIFSKLRAGLLAYLILFGGGTFYVFFCQLTKLFHHQTALDILSHHFISKYYPWTVFLSSIWIPQRASVMGIVLLTSAMLFWLSHTANRGTQKSTSDFSDTIYIESLVGLFFALSFVAHFYFAFVGVVIVGGNIFLRTIFYKYQLYPNLRSCGTFILSTVIFAIPSIFILFAKKSVMKFTIAWMPWNIEFLGQNLTAQFIGSVAMWMMNGVVLLVIFGLIFRNLRREHSLVLAFLFLFFNFFQMSVWDWDSIKGFVALYVALICFFCLKKSADLYKSRYGLIVLIFCLPAVLEFVIIFTQSEQFVLNTKNEIYTANLLNQRTPDGGVVVSQTSHNSVVTLAGRKLYLGYEGWLGSHGIDISSRGVNNEAALRSLNTEQISKELDYPIFIYNPTKVKPRSKPGPLVYDNVLPGLVKVDPRN